MEDATSYRDRLVKRVTSATLTILQTMHTDGFLCEAYRERLHLLRKELGYQDAGDVERLLIERIAMCWYHLNQAEVNLYRNLKESMSLAKSDHLHKCVEQAERRYQASIRSLAQIRRLQLPATVQINVCGEKQVNIAQGSVQVQAETTLTLTEPSFAPFGDIPLPFEGMALPFAEVALPLEESR